MAFESLSERLGKAFKKYNRKGKAERKKYERHAARGAYVVAGGRC